MSATAQRLKVGAWFVCLWLTWALIQGPYIVMRGLGDDLWTGRDVEALERALFVGHVPTRLLQESIYAADTPWLDYISFLAHGFWFGIPWAFGLLLMLYQRERLLEFMGWQIALFYLCALWFLFLPVRPPWMEPGIDRVLMVRNYGGYVDIDNNPMAAFPSLHAALPAMTAIFFFTRCVPRLRFYGWLAAGFTVVISFAIVYMGEHWVIDVLGGYAMALLTARLFTSRSIRRLCSAVPFDPVGRLAAMNQQICRRAGLAGDPAPLSLPEPVREAA